MKKKYFYLILSVLIIGVLVGAILLFAPGILSKRSSIKDIDNNLEPIIKNDKDAFLEDTNDLWLSKRNIDIINNSSEYEIQMYLCFDNDKIPFIELEYYLDGASKINTYSTTEISELEGVKENNNQFINNAILNTKYGKLYFFTEKELLKNQDKRAFSFYMLNLKTGKIKKLHNGEGENNKIIFSPDMKYTAFDYLGVEEVRGDSYIQIFNCEVENDNVLVLDNKTADGKNIGKAADNRYYSYQIIRWKGSEELRLKEYSYTWNNEKKSKERETETDVVFNLINNSIIYPEGIKQDESEKIKPADTQGKNEENENQDKIIEQEKDTDSPEGDLPDDNNDDDNEKPDEATEPEKEDQDIEIEIEDNEKTSEEIEETLERDEDLPEKEREEENEEEKEEKSVLNEEATIEGATYVLKRFYESINNGAYEEAYDLLDERVKFNAFKKLFSQIFGDIEIEIEIDKEDIDVEYFALFIESTGMFKNDEIGKIISEEINNNNSIISYYHTMIMTTSSGIEQEINMPMIATLNKTEKGWRILAFDDGDMNNEPFNTSPF
jgi:hypothetical protein